MPTVSENFASGNADPFNNLIVENGSDRVKLIIHAYTENATISLSKAEAKRLGGYLLKDSLSALKQNLVFAEEGNVAFGETTDHLQAQVTKLRAVLDTVPFGFHTDMPDRAECKCSRCEFLRAAKAILKETE